MAKHRGRPLRCEECSVRETDHIGTGHQFMVMDPHRYDQIVPMDLLTVTLTDLYAWATPRHRKEA